MHFCLLMQKGCVVECSFRRFSIYVGINVIK